MAKQIIYTVGGTVQAGGGIYIKRKADDELLELCQQSEFAFILSSRQVGKSSLIVRTAQQLESENIRSVLVDLSAIGVKVSPDEWYMGILNEISSSLGLKTDVFTWWINHAKLGPAQRLTSFFKDVLLKEVKEQIVLFFDEIDSTLSISFSDDFYVAIRAVYNARATVPDFKRLSFVLVGVATPSDLISDNKRTPFNVGRRVEITDFNLTEAFPLVENFGIQATQILTWVFQHTGGHPYLTQRLCAYLARSKEILDEENVIHAVERLFTGEQGRQDNNLQFVRDMLSVRAPDVKKVLRTYSDIRSGKNVTDDERSVAKAHLKLSGIVRPEKGFLKVRNAIYHKVFNTQWIQENTPKNRQPAVFASLGGLVIILLALIGISSGVFQKSPEAFNLPFFQFIRTSPTPRPLTSTPVFTETFQVPFTPTQTATLMPTSTITSTTAPSGPPTEITSQGAAMILVPAGAFEMGAMDHDLYAETQEKPIHTVELDAYYIDKFEVTNALYQKCVDAKVCKVPIQTDNMAPRNYYLKYPGHPVVYVNWNMAKTYCEWRGVRLPTEAEWEKAARGVEPRLYPWGDTEPNCTIANYKGPGSCDHRTLDVNSKSGGQSSYGVFQMAGNVWEWVHDWYSQDYYSRSEAINPTGAASGVGRVMRGGSWNSTKDDIRISKRRSFPPNNISFDLGFRCAQSVSSP